MAPGQRKPGFGVIEAGALPLSRVVAAGAVLREASRRMIRIGGLLVGVHVAGGTVFRQAVELTG